MTDEFSSHATASTWTLGVPIIAPGIGVDEAIHFLHHFRIDLPRWASHDAAVEAAFGLWLIAFPVWAWLEAPPT
jgi:hypothetical protein